MRSSETVGRQGWRQLKSPGGPEAARAQSEEASPDAAQRRSALVARLTYSIIVLYALTFALLSIQQHDSFGTNAFDLGNMDQAVWNTVNGRWFHFTNWEGSHSRLAAHVEPILLPISLLYKIASTPKTLLVLQSVVISLGALPAFWLARKRLANDFAGVAFASAYLLAPELEAANLADFHAVSLSAAFLLFAFYFVDRRRYLLFSVFAVLAMATKEEIPLVVFLMGLYIVFIQKRRRFGWIVAGFSLMWFVVAFFVVIPMFNPLRISPYFSRYDYMGSSPREILFELVFDPGKAVPALLDPVKMEYLGTLLGPLAYLSLLSPTTLALAIPDLGINLLSSFEHMYSGGAHYSSAIVPVVIISAIFGAANVSRVVSIVSPSLAQPVTYILSSIVLILSIKGYYENVVLPLSDHFPVVTSHHRLAQEFIQRIPPDQGVSAGSALNPHVSHRERLYLFPDVRDAEYVLLDVTASPHPIDVGTQSWKVRELLQSGQWGVEAAEDGYLLLRRGAESRELPAEFFTFTEARKPNITYRRNVVFGNALRFLGYDLHPRSTTLHGREAYAQMTMYWEVVKPVQKDYWITTFVVSSSRDVLEAQPYQASTVWRPTRQWQEGQIVRVEALHLPLRALPYVDVQLGVIPGTNPMDINSRLRPDLSEDLSAELNEDGTLLYLFRLRAG